MDSQVFLSHYLDQVKSRIDLSWGMDALDALQKEKISLANQLNNRKQPIKVIAGTYTKKS